MKKILIPSILLLLFVSLYFFKQQDLSRAPSSIAKSRSCVDLLSNFFILRKEILPNSMSGTISKTKVHLQGESGFFKKIGMIKDAKPGTNLDLAYFIIEDDYSSSYLARELIKASKRGVKVRIVVDYMMSEKYLPLMSFLASHKGIKE